MKQLDEVLQPGMAGTKPEEVTRVQMELERALTKAQTLDETLAAVMDAASDTIFSSEGLSPESLQEVEAAMKGEAEQEEASVLDNRIAAGLSHIEEEMKKEMK